MRSIADFRMQLSAEVHFYPRLITEERKNVAEMEEVKKIFSFPLIYTH